MKKISILLSLGLASTVWAAPFQQAEVTRTVNQVSLLQNKGTKPAKIGDVVTGQTGVRTGADSRAELQFPDQTITRIGANALFRFETGSRNMTLDGGTMLFSSPKGEGGGQVQAGAVTAAVTGTDFLLSYVKGGEVKVIVLEGKVLVSLLANPKIRRLLRGGQMVIIPANPTTIPGPVTIDLRQLLSTSRLLEAGGFEPLFSNALIQRVAAGQKIPRPGNNLPDAAYQSQQAAQMTRRTVQGPPQPPGPRPMATPPAQPAPPTQPAPPPLPAPTPYVPPPTPNPTGTPF